MKREKGLFITLEGGEGSGKSTVSRMLKEWLEERGESVVLTREPGGTETAEMIRELILKREMDPLTEAFLFAAARNEHVNEVIVPALEEGKIVISDRYIDSSFVYQGIVEGLGVEKVYEINRPMLERATPDITFLLDVSPSTSEYRVKNRLSGSIDRFDRAGIEFFEKVRKGYYEVKRIPEVKERMCLIPQRVLRAEDVTEWIVRCLKERFPERFG